MYPFFFILTPPPRLGFRCYHPKFDPAACFVDINPIQGGTAMLFYGNLLAWAIFDPE
jgi:hypothetical protein